MKRGDVLFWPEFKFKDGGTPSTKLMLIGGADKYGDLLLYRTTSQPSSYRPDGEGCHADASVYRFRDSPKPFDKATWVQFEDPYVFSVAEIRAKNINVEFSLSEVQMQAILNCLRRSPEYAKWLSGYGV